MKYKITPICISKGWQETFQMLQLSHLRLNYYYSLWHTLDHANLHSPKSFTGMVREIAEATNNCQSITLVCRVKKLN